MPRCLDPASIPCSNGITRRSEATLASAVVTMELYNQETRGKVLLSAPKMGASGGVGVTGTNTTCRATLGLRTLYAAVDATASRKRPRASSENSVFPQDDGLFGGEKGGVLESSKKPGGKERAALMTSRVSAESLSAMPLFGHRYRYVSTIGTGEFADVIRADDTFRPGRSVAIKVMKRGCEAIGIREVRLMRLLGSGYQSEVRRVLRLLDVLTFRGHCCLVMELFNGTLHPYTVRAARKGEQEGGTAPGPRDRGRSDPFVGLRQSEQMGDDRGSQRSGASAAGWASAEPGVTWSRRSAGASSFSRCVRAGDEDLKRRTTAAETPSRCPIHVIRHVALQLVSSLLLLHTHGLIHGDIKPQNVLLGVEDPEPPAREDDRPPSRIEDFMDGRAGLRREWDGCSPAHLAVKLCDFGSTIHKSEACLYYGDFEFQTLAYRAPEVLMGCPFGPAIDTWSVGVVVLELVLGRPLFHTAGSRAALLRQFTCAFGPVPLRRFRVGRYYSECFAQGQSQVNQSDAREHRLMGCCSCCWIGDRVLSEHEGHTHLGRRRCEGACTQKCRLPDVREGLHGGTTKATRTGATPLPATGSRGSTFPGSVGGGTGGSALDCPAWGVAHAHLCRLLSVSDVGGSQELAVKGAQQPPADGASAQQRCSPLLARPHARRPFPGDSTTARCNPRLLSLLAGLLCFDPDKRLTPRQALAHPFFDEVLPFPSATLTTAENSDEVEVDTAARAAAFNPARSPGAPLTTTPAEATAPVHRFGRKGQQPGGTLWESVSEPTPLACAPTSIQRESSRLRCEDGAEAERSNGHDPDRNKPPTVSGADASQSCLANPSRHDDAVAFSGGTPAPFRAPGTSDFGDLDPTAQLRRLAEMAQAMVGKCGDYSNSHDGHRTESGTSGTILQSPSRNKFLNASTRATIKHWKSRDRAGPDDPGVPAMPSEASTGQRTDKVVASEPSTPAAAAAAAAPYQVDGVSDAATPIRRRHNRFLTPATLAKLGHTLREKYERTAAVGVAVRSSTPAKCGDTVDAAAWVAHITPAATTGVDARSERGLVESSLDEGNHPRRARRPMGVGEEGKGENIPKLEESCCMRVASEGRKRPRRSGASVWKCAANSGGGAERTGDVRRTTARRRAAVEAGIALSRLRDDDSDSDDDSLSL